MNMIPKISNKVTIKLKSAQLKVTSSHSDSDTHPSNFGINPGLHFDIFSYLNEISMRSSQITQELSRLKLDKRCQCH